MYEQFKQQRAGEIAAQGADGRLAKSTQQWLDHSLANNYSYHFEWLGRPIIQYPQDVLAVQELIWAIKPELIIETGIAHGGSLIFCASMLELNAICGGPRDAGVLGVDIDVRPHNRASIEAHPLAGRITMIQGSSIADEVMDQVRSRAVGKRVLVLLDSNHSHAHVLSELELYAPLVAVGSYCVVFDTVIEEMAAELFMDRSWGPGNSPKTAVREFLRSHPEFVIDREMDHKLLISVAAEGYLRRIG